MSDDEAVTVVYAQGDEDIVAIHKFLCVVAGPTLPYPIEHRNAVEEIWRVVNHDVALIALKGRRMIGTLGLLRPDFWYTDRCGFLANRWFFTLPNENAGYPLLREAKAIAVASNLELHIIAEAKGKIVIFNKSPRRKGYPPSLANSPNNSTALAQYARCASSGVS